MNIHQLFPDHEDAEMAADPKARIAELERALFEIQQMSIRRQIEELDDLLDGVQGLSQTKYQSDSVWLESLHEFCERALRGGA